MVTEHPSIEENGEGLLPDARRHGVVPRPLPRRRRGSSLRSARLSGAGGTSSGLPPALIYTAQYDPLRDDGDAYAEALSAAGVKVIHRRFDGLIHGFFALGPLSQAAEAAVTQICDDLRGVLTGD